MRVSPLFFPRPSFCCPGALPGPGLSFSAALYAAAGSLSLSAFIYEGARPFTSICARLEKGVSSAMADAAVNAGMPRKQSYTFAAQAVLGSAKMVLETGLHPGELKDMVCSPAGTTIEAVKVLEEKGFRASIIDAMDACVKKSESM